MCDSYFQDFFIKFSRSQPCILSRSALQLLYLGGRNGSPLGANVPEALREAARTFICPPALVPRYQLLNNPQVIPVNAILISFFLSSILSHLLGSTNLHFNIELYYL